MLDNLTNTPPAQPAPVPEPVARQYQGRDGVWKDFISEKHFKDTLEDGTWPIRALYTTPPAAQRQWVGLTDEDIKETDWHLSADREYEQWTLQEQLVVCGVKEFAQAIEAKLKEKNT
jgi:hypothetical protein